MKTCAYFFWTETCLSMDAGRKCCQNARLCRLHQLPYGISEKLPPCPTLRTKSMRTLTRKSQLDLQRHHWRLDPVRGKGRAIVQQLKDGLRAAKDHDRLS